ncbi:hypothetical protein [Maribacter spongiicola]|nr:hypothetical protein [Maribacter spongiicola]
MILRNNKVIMLVMLILILQDSIYGQSLKGESFRLFKLNVPEIKVPDDYKYYDFELKNNVGNILVNIDGEKSPMDYKQPDITSYINRIRLYNNIYYYIPDLIIKIDGFNLEHNYYVESDSKRVGSEKVTYYTAIFDVVGSLNLKLEDKTGSVLFEERIEYRKNADKIAGDEDSGPFKDKAKAISAMVKQAPYSSSNYKSYHKEVLRNLVANLSQKLNRKAVSYYYPINENLYFFKKPEKFNFDIKFLFKDLFELKSIKKYSEDYREKFQIVSTKLRGQLLAELAKITETDKSSELKKKWVLYTNLGNIEYALGNIEKAQEYLNLSRELKVYKNYHGLFDLINRK